MHTDALGNIVTVTGNNGEIRLRQATSPFGETITQGFLSNGWIVSRSANDHHDGSCD
jgi:hypothetical protein